MKINAEKRMVSNKYMKRFSEQLQKKAETIRLSKTEKDDLRNRVVSYMEYHPLPVTLKVADNKSLLTEDTKVSFLNINNWRFVQGFVGVFALVLIGVSYLAEKTVPGDSLYAVKVNFNEEIRSTLARGSYEKVVWETERLNRRIAEARLLANEGRLTEQAQSEVANAVRSHSENARREIATLKKTNKDEATLASIQLETVLDIQNQVIASENSKDNDVGTTDGKPSLIAAAVADSKQLANDETMGEGLPSYDKLTAYVESETTRAYELLKNVESTATGEEKADIERRLEDINRVITSANGQKENDDTTARHELVKVLQQTQKLIIFMTNIGIRKVVTVEQLVPVTLTIEERNQALRVSANKIIRLVKVVEPTLSATSTAPEMRGKFGPVLTGVLTIASSTLASLPKEEDDLGKSETDLADGLAKIRDVATVLELDLKTLEAGIHKDETVSDDQTSTSSVSIDTSATSTEIEISASSTIEETTGEVSSTSAQNIKVDYNIDPVTEGVTRT